MVNSGNWYEKMMNWFIVLIKNVSKWNAYDTEKSWLFVDSKETQLLRIFDTKVN